MRIGAIVETHIHADFVSGSLELARRTGAPIYASAYGDYELDYRALYDGESLDVGKFRLRAIHTPGHTPEHLCFLVSGGDGAEGPWGLFSGDTLFAGEVGRPDLLGDETEQELARQLYASLHRKILPLGDEIELFPAHGVGSPCGATIGDRQTSTLGYERRHNPLLQPQPEETFVQRLLAKLSPPPAYYPRMKAINRQGGRVLDDEMMQLKPLDADEFRQAMEEPNTVVIDARAIEAFGGAHIAGAVNIALRREFPVWVGRVIDIDRRILLVLPDAEKLDAAARHLLRIGCDHLGGYLRRGMREWFEAGLCFETLAQMSVHQLKHELDAKSDLQLLDVRTCEEWKAGHLPGAQHIPADELAKMENGRSEAGLDRSKPVAVYCGSGFRASIAASLLQRQGFAQVYNIPGSIDAWKAAGYLIE
jgi:hydroxyacylglutathione hydrolase